MGIMYVYLIERLADTSMLRAMIIIGLLGAFTTFSTFSIETLQLFENGEVLKTMLNILLSVVVCLMAVWSGVVMARYLAS